MRKPVSKHALRRALEQVRAQGLLSWETPTGAVVDQVWHHIEKSAFNAGRRKTVTRETVRGAAPAEALEV
jgi:DNA-binding FadR family transcriptional regulator